MAHKFNRDEKLAALRNWHDKLQEHLDVVGDALNEADALERWEVQEGTRERAYLSAYDYVIELANRLDLLSNYLVRFNVPPASYQESIALVREKSEVVGQDMTSFTVPLWAVDRAKTALKRAGIKFTTEPTK